MPNDLRFLIIVIMLPMIILTLCYQQICHAKTIVFSNIVWQVRDGDGYPGPNHWSNKNVWVDENGWLHLRITYKKGKWLCSGVYADAKFGFGQYWFYTIGRLDRLDPNVALALFNYTNYEIGPDQTNEIDIEFSKWGNTSATEFNTSYTVWPTNINLGRSAMMFKLNQSSLYSTHGFIWDKKKIYFLSSDGHYSDYDNLLSSWVFSPPDYLSRIPQHPLPVYIYFYLVKGMHPITNSKKIEIIIKKFSYKSE